MKRAGRRARFLIVGTGVGITCCLWAIDASAGGSEIEISESTRCSHRSHLNSSYFAGDLRSGAQASVLAKVAYHLWPENPDILTGYTRALLEEGKLEEATEYLVGWLQESAPPENALATMLGLVSHLVDIMPPEEAIGRLDQLLDRVPESDYLRAGILAGFMSIHHTLGNHEKEFPLFRQVVDLQPLNTETVPSAALLIFDHDEKLSAGDGAFLYVALSRATLLPAVLVQLAHYAAAVGARGAAGRLESVLESRNWISAEELDELRHYEGHSPQQMATLYKAREFLEDTDWSFLQPLEEPGIPLELKVRTRRNEFRPGEMPSLDVVIRNGGGVPVPVGATGSFSNRIYVYGWTLDVQGGEDGQKIIHSDLVNVTFHAPDGVPANGELVQTVSLGGMLSGLIMDLYISKELKTVMFGVSGIEEDIHTFDLAFFEYASRAMESGEAREGSVPKLEIELETSQEVLVGPVATFQRKGVQTTDVNMGRLLDDVRDEEVTIVHQALDSVKRLYEGHVVEGSEIENALSRWQGKFEKAIESQLESPDYCVRAAAGRALLSSGEEIEPSLVKRLLRDENWYVRFSTLEELGEGGEGMPAEIEDILKDENHPLVLEALLAFTSAGEEDPE